MTESSKNPELLRVFKEEADQLISAMREELSSFANEPGGPQDKGQVLRELFRCAHTLKSSSRTMGFDHLAALAVALEEAFKAARNGELCVTSETLGLLSKAVEACAKLLADEEVDDYQALLDRLREVFEKCQ